MLTFPAMSSSIMTSSSRYRLPDSSTSVSAIQAVLNAWWKTCGVRDATKLLRPIVTVWPSRGIPLPSDLVADTVFSLVIEMARADPTIHPRHSRIVCALIAEHGSTQGVCMGTSRKPEFEAMELSRTMLKAFSKYRDLVRDPCKQAAVMRRCTTDERLKLESILASILLPTCHDDDKAAAVGKDDDMFGDVVAADTRESVSHHGCIVAADTRGSMSHRGGIVAADTRGSKSHHGGIVAADTKGGSSFKWEIDDLAAEFGHSLCVGCKRLCLYVFIFRFIRKYLLRGVVGGGGYEGLHLTCFSGYQRFHDYTATKL